MRATMSSAVLLAVVALTAVAAAVAAGSSDSCTGTPNEHPLYTGQPVLLNTTANGRKYMVGPATLEPKLSVLHVYGSPYEMGLAYGTLMREEINSLIPEAMEWMHAELLLIITQLPPSWVPEVEKHGIAYALNLTYTLTKPFIPAEFIQEVQGVADGSGLPFSQIMNLAMFPELIKAGCSMFGAWSDATATSRDGALVQLRALDWETSGPFQKFPMVIVYHPEAGNGHEFASMGWAGFVGSITGYSSVDMGVCEKVWLRYDGKSSRAGIPFNFLLRDILQYDTSIAAAVERIETASRTCSIFVGVGNANEESKFRGIEYSYGEVNVYSDVDFPAWPPTHDKMEGIVFWDKHEQPSHDPCLNDLLQENYGNIDTEITFRNITAVFQTGDMHIAVMDFAKGTMTVANAAPAVNGVCLEPAYNRPFIQLNMTEIFAVPQPSS